MELQPLSSTSVFDGQRDQHLVKIMPVNRITTKADLRVSFESHAARANLRTRSMTEAA